jgi:hypothetical protein
MVVYGCEFILLDSFELGDKYASFAIAYCYHSGCDDFDINLDKAIYWYKINFEWQFQQVLQDCHICILFDNILMLYLSLF